MEIQELRLKINQIDEQLVKLFEERMRVVLEIGKYKKAHQMPVYDAAREREVLGRQAALVDEEMSGYVRLLYHTLFDVSRSYQHQCMQPGSERPQCIAQAKKSSPPFPVHASVACQKEAEAACRRLFDQPVINGFESCEDVLRAVESGACAYGVLPVENAAGGLVRETLDLISKHHVFIVRSVRTDGRFVRFVCVSREMIVEPEATQTSLMLKLNNQPGALYGVLGKCAAQELNLRNLETGPVNETDCRVYMEVEAPAGSDGLLQLPAQLEASVKSLAFLGSYREI